MPVGPEPTAQALRADVAATASRTLRAPGAGLGNWFQEVPFHRRINAPSVPEPTAQALRAETAATPKSLRVTVEDADAVANPVRAAAAGTVAVVTPATNIVTAASRTERMANWSVGTWPPPPPQDGRSRQIPYRDSRNRWPQVTADIR